MDFVDWDAVDGLKDQLPEPLRGQLRVLGHHSLVVVALGAPSVLFDR